MEFLSDAQCCTKCLKKGIRNPIVIRRWACKWCGACTKERYRRINRLSRKEREQHLRREEWERRALMSPEERKRTPMVHIPPVHIRGKRIGEWRNPLGYLARYAWSRKAVMLRLQGVANPYAYNTGRTRTPVTQPKKRHVVLPTS